MFTCPFTGETEGLVPSRRLLSNGRTVVIWVSPAFKGERYITE